MASSSKQNAGVHLELLCSEDWGLLHRPRCTILPSTDTLVLCGKESPATHWSLFSYGLSDGQVTRLEGEDPAMPCEHPASDLLNVIIEGQDLIAVTCTDRKDNCRDIKLVTGSICEILDDYNSRMEKGNGGVAYKSSVHRGPFRMCHGDPGRLWALCESGEIVELDCTTFVFRETGRVVQSGLWDASCICYLPGSQKALAVCNSIHTRVVSCDNGNELWHISWEASGPNAHSSRALLHYPEYNLLFSAGNHDGLMVLNATTGKKLQRAQVNNLPRGQGNFRSLHWCKNHQLVCLGYKKQYERSHISLFSVSVAVDGKNFMLDQNFLTGSLAVAFDEACRHGTRPSYRARINIIGHSGVGKTTLTRRLLGRSFLPNQESTEGIVTHRIEYDLTTEENNRDRQQIWAEATLDTQKQVQEFNREVICRRRNQDQHRVAVKAYRAPAPRGDPAEIVERDAKDEEASFSGGIYSNVQQSMEVDSKLLEELKNYTEKAKAKDEEGKENKQWLPGWMRVVFSPVLLNKTGESKTTKEEVTGVLRLWDFGGQTEFYTTHHMFLDSDAVNIIVMDISKGLKEQLKSTDDDLIVGIPNTPEEFLCYWLRTIQSQANPKQTQHHVALVFTHKDVIMSTDVDKYIENYKANVQQVIQKSRMHSIPETRVYVVDNKDGSEDEFNNLRCQLHEMITKQNVGERHWGMLRPINWLKLEADMHESLDTTTNLPAKHLTMKEVTKLSQLYGMTSNELESFLQFHHTMGDFVFFPDESLRHTVILDPQWLVDIFKILITPQQFINKRSLRKDIATLLSQGVVTSSSLEKLWAGHDVRFLTELMMKFNLILPLGSGQPETEDRKFLIPCMLPAKTINLEDSELFCRMKMVYMSQHISKFDEMYPIGTFSRLLSECWKHWPLREDDHLSYGHASFEVEAGFLLALTLPHRSTVEVSIWCQPEAVHNYPMKLLLRTRRILARKLAACGVPPNQKFSLVCPHWKPRETHLQTVRVKEILEPGTEDEHRIVPKETQCLCHRTSFVKTSFDPDAPRQDVTCPDTHAESAHDSHGADPQRELTDLQLIQVAKHIGSAFLLSEVGTCLGIRDHTIDAYVYSYRLITEAALQVLKEWRATVGTAGEAWKILAEVLVQCKLAQTAIVVLGWTPQS